MKYQENNDPNAVAAFALSYSSGAVCGEICICLTPDLTRQQPGITPIALLFYDAPIPPQGIFDDFLAMPTTQQNVSSRSFLDLVWSLNFFNPPSNVSVRLVTDSFESNSNEKLTRYTQFLQPRGSGHSILTHCFRCIRQPDDRESIPFGTWKVTDTSAVVWCGPESP